MNRYNATGGLRARAIARVSSRSRGNGPFGRAEKEFDQARTMRSLLRGTIAYLYERETIVSSFFPNSRRATRRESVFFHLIILTRANSLTRLN